MNGTQDNLIAATTAVAGTLMILARDLEGQLKAAAKLEASQREHALVGVRGLIELHCHFTSLAAALYGLSKAAGGQVN